MTENLSKKTAENARSQCKTNCKANVSCLDKEKDIERDKYNTVGRKSHIIIYSTLFYSILIYSILRFLYVSILVPLWTHSGTIKYI